MGLYLNADLLVLLFDDNSFLLIELCLNFFDLSQDALIFINKIPILPFILFKGNFELHYFGFVHVIGFC